MPYRKKLIEVALPLKAINEASAKEKSIRHGHPSTLHLWWARRPLAACRAVLFSSLVDDPDSDPAYRKADGTVDVDRAGMKRAQLFNLIEELVLWENSNNPRVINAARAEIARCVASRKIELGELAKETIIFGDKKGQKHPKGPVSGEGVTAWEVLLLEARPEVVNAFLAEYAPPVLDPFCGGGSIPLEAQRLGLRAYASDGLGDNVDGFGSFRIQCDRHVANADRTRCSERRARHERTRVVHRPHLPSAPSGSSARHTQRVNERLATGVARGIEESPTQ